MRIPPQHIQSPNYTELMWRDDDEVWDFQVGLRAKSNPDGLGRGCTISASHSPKDRPGNSICCTAHFHRNGSTADFPTVTEGDDAATDDPASLQGQHYFDCSAVVNAIESIQDEYGNYTPFPGERREMQMFFTIRWQLFPTRMSAVVAAFIDWLFQDDTTAKENG